MENIVEMCKCKVEGLEEGRKEGIRRRICRILLSTHERNMTGTLAV
jgi:hypothetical protein